MTVIFITAKKNFNIIDPINNEKQPKFKRTKLPSVSCMKKNQSVQGVKTFIKGKKREEQ